MKENPSRIRIIALITITKSNVITCRQAIKQWERVSSISSFVRAKGQDGPSRVVSHLLQLMDGSQLMDSPIEREREKKHIL